MSGRKELVLHSTWFGSFILKDGRVMEYVLFPKEPEELASRRLKRKKGELLDEERDLAAGVDGILHVTSSRLRSLGEPLHDHTLPDISPEEYSFDHELLHEMLGIVGSEEISSSVGSGEHIAKAINTIQDINETVNILTERLRDWYTLHFPELKERVTDDDFLRTISELGERRLIMEEMELDLTSVGGEIGEEEREFYMKFADVIIQQREFRSALRDYIEIKMEKEAPSLTTLAGPKLGAELIAHAGSLERLARMPASTIQVLGAEKSLFRHLEKGTPPPKHGLILQHPYVHRASPGDRGKAARLLANKIAIATRVDHFGGESVGDTLREEVKAKLDRITEKG